MQKASHRHLRPYRQSILAEKQKKVSQIIYNFVTDLQNCKLRADAEAVGADSILLFNCYNEASKSSMRVPTMRDVAVGKLGLMSSFPLSQR